MIKMVEEKETDDAIQWVCHVLPSKIAQHGIKWRNRVIRGWVSLYATCICSPLNTRFFFRCCFHHIQLLHTIDNQLHNESTRFLHFPWR